MISGVKTSQAALVNVAVTIAVADTRMIVVEEIDPAIVLITRPADAQIPWAQVAVSRIFRDRVP